MKSRYGVFVQNVSLHMFVSMMCFKALNWLKRERHATDYSSYLEWELFLHVAEHACTVLITLLVKKHHSTFSNSLLQTQPDWYALLLAEEAKPQHQASGEVMMT